MNYLNNWLKLLDDQTIKDISEINKKLDELRKTTTIYPPKSETYKALELTDPENIKVVILGQDPYHNKDQANGLAFAVNNTIQKPPSLKNIDKLLYKSYDKHMKSSDLISWANQGVLLLNTSLSVAEHKPNSHKNLDWNNIIKDILKTSIENNPNIILIAWGSFAHKAYLDMLKDINSPNIDLFISSHPSPFSALKPYKNYPAFMDSNVFKKINEKLINKKLEPINWFL